MSGEELKAYWGEMVKLEKLAGFRAVDVCMKLKIKELMNDEC